MNFKGLIVVILAFLVIYGVYYFVVQVDFVQILSIPRLLNPFPTSSTPPPSTPTRPSGGSSAPPVVSAPRAPTPPQGFSVNDLSSYYDKVSITSVQRPTIYGQGGEFTLHVESSAGAPVNVTGWEVRSNRASLFISGAYAPVGPVNQSAIVISPNTSAAFYSAWSAFVKNIALNTCTGYLNDQYTLAPKLPANCPRPAQSELITFSGECQNFITSLQSCEAPDSADVNRFTGSRDVACRAFLDTLTYDRCVQKYRDLSNFYSYGWRVWMGTEFRFDRLHDRLLLFDGAGKLVDEYIY